MELRYLSYSIVRDFLVCPEKGRLSHIERLKKPGVKGVLLFGTGIHFGIESFYKEGVVPWEAFSVFWNEAVSEIKRTGEELIIDEDEGVLENAGKVILKRWLEHEETPKDCWEIEKSLKIEIEGIPFYATVDYIGEEGKVLLDWKTSSFRYNGAKGDFDLQLTAYSYMMSEVLGFVPEKVGFGVFVKKKDPEVQYVWGRKRTKDDFENFKRIVKKVYLDVMRGEFFKNYGMQCQWCDFLPLCLGEADESAYVRKDGGYYEKYEIE
ncbi:MAG: RecB family exonuclease [Caldimicrobium sp.]